MKDILSERLLLRLVPLAGLAATVQGKPGMVEKLMGVTLPPAWCDEDWVFKLRYDQWLKDPAYAPWSIRAIVERDSRAVVGTMNSHHQPMPFVMNDQKTAGVELGYTIFEPYRRQGFATEAIGAYTAWAGLEHGVSTFVLSISPLNEPSLGLARKLGAEQIGSEMHERNGEQLIHAFQRILPVGSSTKN